VGVDRTKPFTKLPSPWWDAFAAIGAALHEPAVTAQGPILDVTIGSAGGSPPRRNPQPNRAQRRTRRSTA
jgi:hypothetical protein